MAGGPSLESIRSARSQIDRWIVSTPVWELDTPELGDGTNALLKLECLQRTGTFKARGALIAIGALSDAAKQNGVTAVSAGNHARAVGYAARVLGTSAKVVMPKSANPERVELVRAEGAEICFEDTIHAAFARARQLAEDEGRTLIHPFEGPEIALGTATLGLELAEQAPRLDAVIIPIGGGGLCGGMACAIHEILPECRVFGVEPFGADSMFRSLQAGSPQRIDAVRTIADSLGAPAAEPYSFGLCREHVEAVVRIEDAEMISAMRVLHRAAKLAVEPAAAAATAALLGPLRETLRGKTVGVVVCGSNIDPASWADVVNA